MLIDSAAGRTDCLIGSLKPALHMNDLIELVQLFNKTKLKTNGLLGVVLEPGSKMEQLYDAIAQRKVASDDEARALLYGQEEDSAILSNLKYKLKERLLDSVFLLDYKESNYTIRQKAFLDCYKRWAAAMILLIRNEKINGIDQLEKLLRHAIRFEFTELTLDILRVLRLQYGTVTGDFKRYETVREQYRQYETVWIMESRAEEYYADLMIQYINSKSTKVEVAARAQEYYNELEPFMRECFSFKLHMFGRLIQVMIYSAVNDYANTARLCEDAVRFFDEKDYGSGLPLQVFYYNLIVCYLQLREFDKGQGIVAKSLDLFEPGSFNWFKLQELFFLLAMHTRHYDEAYAIYGRVTNHPRYAGQQPRIQEMWKIFQAYLFYLIKIGKITSEEAAAQTSKFKIGKFLNELSLFNKDKRGMNISILIIQILYSIAAREYDQSIERIDAIEKYCARWLKEKDTFRSNTFIKMMLQIPIAYFHREGVSRKTAKYAKALQTVPLEVARQTHEIEIIPYEDLWEMTMTSLEMKIYQTRAAIRPSAG